MCDRDLFVSDLCVVWIMCDRCWCEIVVVECYVMCCVVELKGFGGGVMVV